MSGSLLAMPMLVINMGGEMVYILEQRLRAQNIPTDKSRKVLSDVVKTMYSKKFIAELFKPQPLYSSRSTRQIFDRLAHSSIMRLNANSMDKLYDLMTMGFKYQMICCASPVHLTQVTLNHLESLSKIVANPSVVELIDNAISLVNSTYGKLSIAEYFSLKHTLCRFFQDRRVKVSLFLQDGTQNMDGTIVLDPTGPLPVGTDPPGKVVYNGRRGTSSGSLRELHIAGTLPPLTGSPYDPDARPCKLGLNMYAKERSKKGPKKAPARLKRGGSVQITAHAPAGGKREEDAGADESKASGTATAGLNLLASLIGTDGGRDAGSGGGSTFKVSNLFAEDIFASDSKSGSEAAVITIDATDRASMQEMMRTLDLEDDGGNQGGGGKEAEDDEDDLLALMDAAG